MARTTTKGLEIGSRITVANVGGRRKYGVVLNPRYVSAHGHERVEYRDDLKGGVCYAKLEDVRIERASEKRRKAAKATQKRQAA